MDSPANPPPHAIGVLGASSMVGACVLSQLVKANMRVRAFSRKASLPGGSQGVDWQTIPAAPARPSLDVAPIPWWICIVPIAALPAHFDWLEAQGIQRIVVLSSTSRFTKDTSSDPLEQAIAQRLADAESQLQTWAESRGIEWVVLRPTLIYQPGQDKNVSEIARFVRRFGFFPVLGKAQGLRQPIHAADVAGACIAALRSPTVANRAYNISGGETLPYRSMVGRIFAAQGRVTRVLSVPLWMFKLAVTLLRCLPRYRQWSAAMAERMNRNLVFDHTEAAQDFGFQPRAFTLEPENRPLSSPHLLSNK
ncbi:NAD-dependent epimerase/dehydratase family protein [Rhodoferax sp. WC2427]|uniref:NAD-dependent epimerase/dehydratase family protein n=1 Tax=Rhodoferax sp. WC2427 TaxID=3234144 RepID=UPI0034655C45